MSMVQPALALEEIEGVRTLEGDAPRKRGRRTRSAVERPDWPLTIILVIAAVTVLVPLYVTISMAFKTQAQAVDGNAFSLPAPFSLEGFTTAWELTNFPVAFVISVLVTAGTVAGTILLACFASFAIHRNWDRKFFRWSFFYLLAAMFIPFPVLALPQIQLTGLTGLDNPVGVTILHIMFQLSFSILLFTAFLRSIPHELEESARIDGASTWQVFWKLIFPLLAPMSATVGHLRVPRFMERLHDAVAHHVRPSAADPSGCAEYLPDSVQQQLQRVVRLVPHGDGSGDRGLPVHAALGHGGRHPGRRQGLRCGSPESPTIDPLAIRTQERNPVTISAQERHSPSTAAEAAPWWRQAVVYQVYPRSFADADGDGLGDLPGIVSRVDHLAELGVDAVWLSPFYPSALADGGYDVADYRDVDPRLGTLDDFDAMVDALHARGIRIVVDIVPNHTSDLHEWFQEALAAGRGSAARERYIFREGKGADGAEPPTDWVSVFGGSAWERVADGQWYLHNFAIEQPDLNWDHPEVRADFVRTLRFWSDRGVDGFRIDVAHMLTKDLTEPLPSRAELAELPFDGQHPLIDRDDVHEIYAEWRRVFNEYDPPRTAVAEAWVEPHARAAVRAPRQPRPGVQLRPAAGGLRRGGVPRDRHRQPRARRGIRLVEHRGCCRTTTSCGTPPAMGCRSSAPLSAAAER